MNDIMKVIELHKEIDKLDDQEIMMLILLMTPRMERKKQEIEEREKGDVNDSQTELPTVNE